MHCFSIRADRDLIIINVIQSITYVICLGWIPTPNAQLRVHIADDCATKVHQGDLQQCFQIDHQTLPLSTSFYVTTLTLVPLESRCKCHIGTVTLGGYFNWDSFYFC